MSGEAEHEERAYVYMVRCAGGQLYTGWTNDPGARLHAHKTGKGAKATRAMGAQRFAYLERCADKSDALRREAALKKLPKAKKEALCAEWEGKNLPRLSVATRADAADILEIYNWYVLNHTATFQVTPSTLEEYEDWVDNTRKVAPLLLARDAEGKLLGYACAHRWLVGGEHHLLRPGRPRPRCGHPALPRPAGSAGCLRLLERLRPCGRPQPRQRAHPPAAGLLLRGAHPPHGL